MIYHGPRGSDPRGKPGRQTPTDYVTVPMGGGEIARYPSSHGGQRISHIALVSSTASQPDVDPQTGAASPGQIRASYGQWVAENAAFSFGDGLPGCAIPQLEKEQPSGTGWACRSRPRLAFAGANMSADLTGELSKITVPLVLHGDHDAFRHWKPARSGRLS